MKRQFNRNIFYKPKMNLILSQQKSEQKQKYCLIGMWQIFHCEGLKIFPLWEWLVLWKCTSTTHWCSGRCASQSTLTIIPSDPLYQFLTSVEFQYALGVTPELMWLKLLPSCLIFGSYGFKMLHFFMRTTEGQHLACLHILENDGWKETTYHNLWDTYGYLKILCTEMWAPLKVRGCAVSSTSCVGTCWICLTTGWKMMAGPCCLFSGNMRKIWHWLCSSAFTDSPVHRHAYFF